MHQGEVRSMSIGIKKSVAVVAVALVALALTLSGSAGSASVARGGDTPNATGGGQEAAARAAVKVYTQDLTFERAVDSFTFTARLGAGGNTFTASTMDCCIINDHWGVFVNRYGGAALGTSNPNAGNCGTGSDSAFTGAATLQGSYLSGKSVKVMVVHCSGVSTFPAGMTLRLSSNVPMTVKQRT